MENFRNVLKRRLALMIGFCVLSMAFVGLIGVSSHMIAVGSENLTDFIFGFQVGIFITLQTMLLIPIAKYGIALKNESKLKKLYVEENDERRKLIQDKIGGVGFNFTLGTIATTTVVAGFFYQIVFATLLGVLIFMALLKGFLKMYYRNKF